MYGITGHMNTMQRMLEKAYENLKEQLQLQ